MYMYMVTPTNTYRSIYLEKFIIFVIFFFKNYVVHYYASILMQCRFKIVYIMIPGGSSFIKISYFLMLNRRGTCRVNKHSACCVESRFRLHWLNIELICFLWSFIIQCMFLYYRRCTRTLLCFSMTCLCITGDVQGLCSVFLRQIWREVHSCIVETYSIYCKGFQGQ